MTASDPLALYRRDTIIAGAEKLRFFPLAVESGTGSYLVEVGGRRLLDLSSTWTATGLGHGHPAVVEAVRKAVASPAGAGGLSAVHPDSVGFAEELLDLVPGVGDRRVYIGHAGSDANDVVIRCSRYATGRRRVVAFEHSYHGGIGVAMSASGVHLDAGSVAATPDVVFVPYPDPYRVRGASIEDAAASLAAVDEQLAAGDVACVIVEPILSDGGLVVPPDGFLAALHEVCKKYAAILICDEVKVGLARPGTMHAFEHDGIIPDIATFGKSIGGGLSLSAAVGPAAVLDNPPSSALLTTAGNPICTAAGRAVMRTLVSEGLADKAAAAGKRLRDGLREATADLDRVGDIRGRGLAIGVDLVTERESRNRDGDLASQTVYRLWELGAVAFYVGGNVLEITPPLRISEDEVDQGVDLLAQSIRDAAAGKVDAEAVKAFAGW